MWLPPNLPARVPVLCSVGETGFRYFIFRNTLFYTTKEQHTIWANHLSHLKNENKTIKIKYFTNDPSFVCPLGNFDLDFPVIPTPLLPYFTCYKNKSTYHNLADACGLWTLVNWIEPCSLLKFNWTKAFACRYKHFWANDHKTITYDRSKSGKTKYKAKYTR